MLNNLSINLAHLSQTIDNLYVGPFQNCNGQQLHGAKGVSGCVFPLARLRVDSSMMSLVIHFDCLSLRQSELLSNYQMKFLQQRYILLPALRLLLHIQAGRGVIKSLRDCRLCSK
jgi:hypothetical protein